MHFEKSEGTTELTNALTEALRGALQKSSRVLWLVPGGSNISVATTVMDNLKNEPLEKLTILLTDERYGDPGHANSNYTQLHHAGFQAGTAVFNGILNGKTFEETVREAEANVERTFKEADFIIGFFGMGSDGHVAGILPGSPAAHTKKTWVCGYISDPYTRITLTPYALSHINLAYVGAFGEEKRQPLLMLRDTLVPVTEQPAQLLRHIPEVHVFNNILGDE